MNLFRVIWRWHFYAGLVITPVLIVTAVTGMLYVFKDEVRDLANASAVFVTPVEEPLQPEALLAALQREHGPVERLFLPPEPNRSWIAHFGGKPEKEKHEKHEREKHEKPKPEKEKEKKKKPEKDHPEKEPKKHESSRPREWKEGVYVHPGTAEVLGPVTKDHAFFKTVLAIHRNLMSGIPGRVFVEISTSWAIVLVLTGLYLWWPKKAAPQGVWYPRWGGKLYAVLRDWHAVLGMYLALPALALLTTGLFFSYTWGGWYKTLQGKDPKGYFEAPKRPDAKHRSGTMTAGVINDFAAEARQRWPHHTLEVILPKKKDTALTVIPHTSMGPKRQAMWAIDPITRETIADHDLRDLSWMAQLRMWAYPIHVGSIGGILTKILAALTCLTLAGLALSGVWMWLARRKKGTLGLPRAPETPVPVWLGAMIVALGIVLPMMGVTLLLFVALEWLMHLRRKTKGPVDRPAPAA
jgi:uncharacterized iron-regulated membrane protein